LLFSQELAERMIWVRMDGVDILSSQDCAHISMSSTIRSLDLFHLMPETGTEAAYQGTVDIVGIL
jgi:hypothetical protein